MILRRKNFIRRAINKNGVQMRSKRVQSALPRAERTSARAPGADAPRKLKMCINYEDYMKKRNVLHLILLHTISYGLATALA